MPLYYIHAFSDNGSTLSNILIYHYFFTLYKKLIIAKKLKLMHNRCAGAKTTIWSKIYYFNHTIILNSI